MNYSEITQNQTNTQKKPARKKYIITIVFALVFLIVISIFIMIPQEPKADPISALVFRRQAAKILNINPSEVTDQDLARVTELNFMEIMEMVEAPSGIEPAANQIQRREIIFLENEVSDIRVLEKFTNIQKLNLEGLHFSAKLIPRWMHTLANFGLFDINSKYVIGLKPLKDLNNLQELYLKNTPVKQIQPLSGLSNLKILDLSSTPVRDLKPLKKMNNLQELFLNNTNISSLKHLKGLTNLKELWLMNCPKITKKQVEDLQKQLPHLKVFYVGKEGVYHIIQ